MEQRSRSSLKLWLGILIGVLATLALFACLAIYAVGCAVGKVAESLQTDTRVAAKASTANGVLELDLTYGNEVTGLATVTVSDMDGNKLWELVGLEKPAKIVYGQVPPEGKQVFPEGDKPPADIRGKKVLVRITNGFRVALGMGQEITDMTVEVPK
jgi:hypothetical protein